MKKQRTLFILYILCASAVSAIVLMKVFGVFGASFAPTPFSTSVCLLAASIALLLPYGSRKWAALIGAAEISVGVATLSQFIVGVNYRIGDILQDAFLPAASAAHAHMMPNTACGIILVGSALILRTFIAPPDVAAPANQLRTRVLAIVGSGVIALGTLPLIGHVVRMSSVTVWGHATFMSVHAALCFVLLGGCLMIFVYRRSKDLLWLPLALGMGLFMITLSLTAAVHEQENAKLDLLLHAKAEEVSDRLNKQLTEFYVALDHMAQRWGATGGMSIKDWESDGNAFLKGYPYLAGMSISNRELRIVDTVPDIYKVFNGSKVNQDIEREVAVKQVAETLKPQSTRILTLRNGPPGFLYICPLFKNGSYDGVQLAAIDVEKLITQLFNADDDWRLFTITISENDKLIFTNAIGNQSLAFGIQAHSNMRNKSSVWTVSIAPTQQLLATQTSAVSMAVMLIGLITTLMVSLCGFLALKWRYQSRELQQSQSFNDALLAEAGPIIVVCDENFIITVFNQAAEQALGYTAGEVINKSTPAIWHDGAEVAARTAELNARYGLDLKPGLEMFRELATRENATTCEWVFVRKDGTRFPVNLSITHMRAANGEITGYMGVGIDVTAQKQQQQALKLSEETFRAAMENASIGMALVHTGGAFMKVNKALCDLLGYREDELLTTDYQQLTCVEDLALDEANVAAVLAGDVPSYQMEKRYIQKNGHAIWALLNVSLVRNADGTPNYFISQVHDITDRKEVENLKDEFVSMVSHELRTPLTSIRGSLGLIAGALSAGLPPQVNHLVGIAHKNAERLIALINDILDIDKIAAGKMRFEYRREALAPLVQQVVDANRAYSDKFGVTVEVEPIPEHYTINVDANRLTQALLNLLSNAAKFSPQGATVKVAVTTCAKGLRISVHDDGSGVPEDFQPRIFHKFSQADSSITREKGGTGLGLYITQQIISQMGGQIGFDTAVGQGSTFWFDFPDADAPSAMKA